MNARRIFMVLVTIILIGAVFVGVTDAFGLAQPTPTVVANLENVRDYAPASSPNGISYAVDGGRLFAGGPNAWRTIETPHNVIVSAVAVDSRQPERVLIGAANEMALYLSGDAGETWAHVPLATDAIGGVTDIAVDGARRLVYVGTDTDGVHRLRDVGTSMVATVRLLLDEPVLEVVADSTGAGMAFVRTRWHFYRAENAGLSWVTVENLPSPATAVAIADTSPATVFVGTANAGLLQSRDGVNWQPANAGLGLVPGSMLSVNALAADPVRPEVLYVATSYLYGSTVLHNSPVGVFMSADGGQAWNLLAQNRQTAVTGLMPVSGRPGAVYALTELSRTPLALGEMPTSVAVVNSSVRQLEQTGGQIDAQAAVRPVEEADEQAVVQTAEQVPVREAVGLNLRQALTWTVAGLAALALILAVVMDLRQQRRQRGSDGPLAPTPAG